MAVTNLNGHGVSSMSGHHNQQVVPVNMQYPSPPAHQSGGQGGPSANDAMNAYSNGGTSKKKFPPAS